MGAGPFSPVKPSEIRVPPTFAPVSAAIRRISAETGVRVGGTLYSDSLTAEKGDSPTYIDMVRHNIKTLTSALAN